MSPIFTSFLLLVGVSYFVMLMYGRISALAALKNVSRGDALGERLKGLIRFGLGQKRMVDPEERTTGWMHIAIFAAFLVLQIRTGMLFVMGFSETALAVLATPNHPFWTEREGLAAAYHVYLLVKDLVAAAAVIGCIYFWRLRARRPDRMTPSAEAILILGFIGGLMITEFLFGASRLVMRDIGPIAWEPVTSLFVFLFQPLPERAVWLIGGAAFWTHLGIVLTFLNFLPIGKHFHVITGLPNVFVRSLTGSKVLPKADLENEEYGANTFTDLNWKQGLDLYSCTECGRCQTHCPTYITGKPLTHKGVNQDLKHWLWEHENEVATGKDELGNDIELPPIVGNILSADTIWACTSCGWCETACPVFIENVPRLIDMRRYKVQVDAEFPPEAQRVFEGMERQMNPWGIGQDKREDWEEGLEVPVPKWSDGGEYEYLFFVGCAGSYDDRQKKVSRALIKIMQAAGVSFATLGKDEACNGDSARRLGNEYLFQTLAESNVTTWNELGVKAVITQCPHCFNTIKNEYPQFGGNYKVINHTELLADLIREGKVKLNQLADDSLTYHDPCYLGRHNGVYDAPRETLQAMVGKKLIEMQRSKRQSFCCGAGGGRMWLEEDIGTRINQNRVNEAALTLAHAKDPSIPFPSATDKEKPGKVGDYTGPATGTVAVACPFCYTMISDAINETGREETLKVKEITELVAESLVLPASSKPSASPSATAAAGATTASTTASKESTES